MPQASAIATHAAPGKSWMLPEARSQKLLYVSNPPQGYVDVFSYPTGKLVGMLTGLSPGGACVDSGGDVFIITSGPGPHESSVLEYAHGASSPEQTLSDPGLGYACSVDPATGNLAVANVKDYNNVSYSDNGDIAIYSNAQGLPTMYYNTEYLALFNCGYDNNGNLYVVGQTFGSSQIELTRLARGDNNLQAINLNVSLQTGERFTPSVQWDGRYMTVSSTQGSPHVHEPVAVYRLNISGSQATIVGTMQLDSERELHSGDSWIDGRMIVGIYYLKGRAYVAFWPYPKGGDAHLSIKTAKYGYLFGVTVSRAPHR
jgi:hypothetical protein